LVICNNHESDVGMNGSVKFVEDLRHKMQTTKTARIEQWNKAL